MQWDIIIIGAGPAGMAAALEAEKLNLRVLVVDRQDSPGGQIYRGVSRKKEHECQAISSDYADGAELVRQFLNSSITYWNQATVWHLTNGMVFVSKNGASSVEKTKQIIIASGAMERPVSIPGWTLPGVYPVGAADILLKSAALVPEGPVAICGNGPLILQTVAHLRAFNVPIAGTALTGKFSSLLSAFPFLFKALSRPKYLAKGTGMMLGMLINGHCHFQSRGLSITKSEKGFSVHFSAIGGQRSLEARTVLLHEGVIPETRITRLLRCQHQWDPIQRYWHPAVDILGQTSIAGVRVAGDCAKVRGAQAAADFGRLAALDAACQIGAVSRVERERLVGSALNAARKHLAVQQFMDRMFAPSAPALTPQDDAIVCRCEELTAAQLKPLIAAGCHSLDGLKSQAGPAWVCARDACVEHPLLN